MTELVATENPEEEELKRKKEELAALENQLANLPFDAEAQSVHTAEGAGTRTLA